MAKCFRVFSEVIAFVCIGSQLVAVRTLLPSDHRVDADAASARANEVEEASINRTETPTSRRGITEGWDVSLPPQRPELYCDGQPKRLPDLDSSSPTAPNARRDKPLRRGTEEVSRSWNSRPTHNPGGAGPATHPPSAVLVGANRLFAGLVLHKVCPRDRFTAMPNSRTGSPGKLNSGRVSAPVPDPELGPERPSTIAQAALPGPLLAPIRTLLAELAWRGLRSLAAKKRA